MLLHRVRAPTTSSDTGASSVEIHHRRSVRDGWRAAMSPCARGFSITQFESKNRHVDQKVEVRVGARKYSNN
jgi:hypothetical protein